MNATPVAAHFRMIHPGRSETFIDRSLNHFHWVRPVVFVQEAMHLNEFPVPLPKTYPPGHLTLWGIGEKLGHRLGRASYFAARPGKGEVMALHAPFGSQGHALLAHPHGLGYVRRA